MNFRILILVTIIVTSCIKVGKNEECCQQRSSERRKIYEKECKTSILVEKSFALLAITKKTRSKQRTKGWRRINDQKVGPFLILLLTIKFLLIDPLRKRYNLYSLLSLIHNSVKNLSKLNFKINKYFVKIKSSIYNVKMGLKAFKRSWEGLFGVCFVKIVLQRSQMRKTSDLVHKLKVRVCQTDFSDMTINFLINLKRFIKTNKMIALTIAITLLTQNVEPHPGPGPNDSSAFSVISFNCNGLGDKNKLKRLLLKVAKLVENNCFILLQETHIINSEYMKLIWKHKFVMNGHTSNSAGLIILFNNKYEVQHVESDGIGRRLIVVLEDESSKFIVANSYLPNDHRAAIDNVEALYTNILDVKSKYNDHIMISGGDFNVCLNVLDQLNRKISIQENELAKSITENNKLLGLKDSFREVHPKNGFTWRRAMTYSRLDYVFISKEIVPNIINAKVDWAFETSDHAAVKIKIKVENIEVKGPGIAKVNVKILDNKDTVKKIEGELLELLKQVDKSWNPHIKLEFMKVMIRSICSEETNKIRLGIRNEIEDREITMNQMQNIKIDVIQKQMREQVEDANRLNQIERSIEFLKCEIHALRDKLSESMAFASKAKWYEKGEKSNKFFLNLNTVRQNQKLISSIKNGNEEFKGQSEVISGIRAVYEDLYKKSNNNTSEDNSFYDECPKLSTEGRNLLENEITMKDLYSALLTCKSSAPGPDGIPYEIYKKFWNILGPLIHESWKYSIEIGILPPSHLESAIVLLPKEGKDSKDIKNWRPITLSNCDLKIITKSLASKMAVVLDQIIVNSQTAYVPGRSVADNLRTNFFFKQFCKSNKVNAVLISLDAKKAFDSVDHKYIEETLRAYGFGPKLINTFKVLYNKITARILVNGFQSESINIERGVKQGDALSCAIFIICIDPLIRNLNKNDSISPICIKVKNKIDQISFKAAAYADDISVICLNTTEAIQEVFSEYYRLTRLSGLELNADKTEILKLYEEGESEIDFNYMGQIHKIKSVCKIKICGLYFCQDRMDEIKLNVTDKLDKVAKEIKKWSHNHLTMEGKVLIIKTFGLSQVIYNMQVHEFGVKDIVFLERLIFGFLWSSSSVENVRGIDRIKRSIMKNEYSKGGLNVTDIECLNRALKTRQFIRASTTKHPISKIQALLSCSPSGSDQIKQEYTNPKTQEPICHIAQSSINILTDYNRSNLNLSLTDENEIAKFVNEIASISMITYFERKNMMFHLCMIKPLTKMGINTLGELYQEYEHEQDTRINLRMKMILNAFPKNLLEFLERINQDTDCNESMKVISLNNKLSKDVSKITTKELQKILKTALGKIEDVDFNHKLGITNFDDDNITNFRIKCKNIKLRSIFFRLIHNDFFTRERLKKYKMVECDKCVRCGSLENTKHLMWECSQVKNIWKLFNKVLGKIQSSGESVFEYEDIYKSSSSSFITLFKIRVIQELIQIVRPKNWYIEKMEKIAIDLIKIEKYNSPTDKLGWKNIEEMLIK